MNEALFAGTIFVVSALLLALVYYRLHGSRKSFDVDVEWWKEFDAARYSPIRRLLDEDDIRYLRSLRGYERSLEKDLRRRRAQIFRVYLREMVADFNRLQLLGKMMVLAGGSPMLREQLFLQKVAFTHALFRVRLQLAASSLGFGSVDAGSLVEAFQSAATAMQSTLPAASAA